LVAGPSSRIFSHNLPTVSALLFAFFTEVPRETVRKAS
jgi:hypothetical protein